MNQDMKENDAIGRTGERKLYIETYGCQMNVADSEVVASIMGMDGYGVAASAEDADAVLLNTCSIRDNAEQKIFHVCNISGRLSAAVGSAG